MKALVFDDINDSAMYLVDFCQDSKANRQKIVLDWMKYASVMKKQLGGGNNARVYLLPGCSDRLICSNACARSIGFGQKAWATVKKAYSAGLLPFHAQTGKRSHNWNKDSDDLLHDFFIKLEGLAAPRATRVVRDVVGDKVDVTLRDDGDEIELPTYYTKRSLYKQLAADLKWEVSSTSKGNITKKQLNDSTVDKLPSWRTFTRFWKRHYSHIRIPRPSEDICEDCHKFVNAYKSSQAMKDESKKRKAATALEDGGDSSNSDDDEDAVETEDDINTGVGGEDSSVSVPSLGTDDDLGEL